MIDYICCIIILLANNDSVYEYSEHERQLLNRCIRLIQGKPRDSKEVKDNDVSSPTEEMTDMSTSMMSSVMTHSSMELCSPERAALPGEYAPFPTVPVYPPGKNIKINCHNKNIYCLNRTS